ncbi:MAG: DUF1214 domain-containing protein [Methylovirgula sp.]
MTILKLLAMLVTGTALGLASTYYVLGHGVNFDEVKAGPWTRWPKTGSTDIDPYAHARLARSGELPLGTAEGLSFFAWTDSSGRRLDASCDYVVKGAIPPTRYWTLSLYTPTGALIDNPTKRYGFTSAEILRAADGNFQIAVSHQARPGNWLPIGQGRSFALVLRLYDTLFDFGMAKVEAAALPQIAKGRCE